MKTLIGLFLIVFACLPSTLRAEQPALQTGDIIFQTSNSKQSYAIMWASKSIYSHVGLVEVSGKNVFVVEAISKVSRTPLKKWIQRGRLGRYAVYRYEGITPEMQTKVLSESKKLLGRNYDIYFTSKNDQIYCSELVNMAYAESGFPIGKMEKVSDLDVDNAVVRRLVEKTLA